MQPETVLVTILAVGLVILIAMSITVVALVIIILRRLNRISLKAEMGLAALSGWKLWRKHRRGNG